MGVAWRVSVNIGRPETACGRPARFRSSGYHAEFHEGCYQKHTNPLNCRTSSSVFPAITWTFTKDKALSENGRGAAWHVRINAARQGREQHGRCMDAAWARNSVSELVFTRRTRQLLHVCRHLIDAGALEVCVCIMCIKLHFTNVKGIREKITRGNLTQDSWRQHSMQ
jgi:hypothetical protein